MAGDRKPTVFLDTPHNEIQLAPSHQTGGGSRTSQTTSGRNEI